MDDVTTQPTPQRRHNQRTCVGCSRRDAPGHLVRVVLRHDGQVQADLRGSAAGRGAHVHPARDCIAKAAKKGLSRSFRRSVIVDASALSGRIVDAASVQLSGLLARAFASGQVVVSHEALLREISHDALSLVVIAADAPPGAFAGGPGDAILRGRAVAWGTCASLGALARCGATSMIGVRSKRLGDAIAQACRVADGARTGAEVR